MLSGYKNPLLGGRGLFLLAGAFPSVSLAFCMIIVLYKIKQYEQESIVTDIGRL